MSIQPLGDYVFLVKKEKDTMVSGIILLSTSNNEFTVYKGGNFIVGDTVVLANDAPRFDVSVGGDDYIVVDKKHILCTL